jgi:hypothetical protein
MLFHSGHLAGHKRKRDEDDVPSSLAGEAKRAQTSNEGAGGGEAVVAEEVVGATPSDVPPATGE